MGALFRVDFTGLSSPNIGSLQKIEAIEIMDQSSSWLRIFGLLALMLFMFHPPQEGWSKNVAMPTEGGQNVPPVVTVAHGLHTVLLASTSRQDEAVATHLAVQKIGLQQVWCRKQPDMRPPQIQVIAGPYSTTTQAQQLRDWVARRTGIQGMLRVTQYPEVVPDAQTRLKTCGESGRRLPVNAPSTAAEGDYIVLVGAFGSQQNGTLVLENLLHKNIPARMKMVGQGERSRFNIMVGPFKDKWDAEDVVRLIKDETGLTAQYQQIH
ncbi:Sporulation domain protein [Magnetococcus marinus MC-1]|uniref:Sporulation domain protein n=1 Tax=Magnetococcus marinus (strain ATCC BAA-1437 / JCM 17883 / MC-1) TaxID=156889 RepID=A0L496_MAGMM|nr:SPOR domain-containing protein [Magnetococcus marinus]ABK42789.1 Sporulation domain protein [Magnetococcus marinus MC-1]